MDGHVDARCCRSKPALICRDWIRDAACLCVPVDAVLQAPVGHRCGRTHGRRKPDSGSRARVTDNRNQGGGERIVDLCRHGPCRRLGSKDAGNRHSRTIDTYAAFSRRMIRSAPHRGSHRAARALSPAATADCAGVNAVIGRRKGACPSRAMLAPAERHPTRRYHAGKR